MIFLQLLFLCGAALADPIDLLSIPSAYINMDVNSTPCLTQNFKYCQEAFAGGINTSYSVWKDPQELNKAVGLLYFDGMPGLLNVCSSRQKFQLCLGTMYDACMNVPQFINSGSSQQDASFFLQIFNKMEFDCNGGFTQMSQNDRCIGTVWILNSNILNSCTDKFNNDIAQKVDYCVASYQYEQCTRLPFEAACGEEASWWQCERTRIGMDLNEFCPQNQCSVTSKHKNQQKMSVGKSQAVFDSYPGKVALLKKMANNRRSKFVLP